MNTYYDPLSSNLSIDSEKLNNHSQQVFEKNMTS